MAKSHSRHLSFLFKGEDKNTNHRIFSRFSPTRSPSRTTDWLGNRGVVRTVRTILAPCKLIRIRRRRTSASSPCMFRRSREPQRILLFPKTNSGSFVISKIIAEWKSKNIAYWCNWKTGHGKSCIGHSSCELTSETRELSYNLLATVSFIFRWNILWVFIERVG